MFIGRQDELKRLEELCCSDSFEFLVMYGRRRVGKTSLLKEYAGKHMVFGLWHNAPGKKPRRIIEIRQKN